MPPDNVVYLRSLGMIRTSPSWRRHVYRRQPAMSLYDVAWVFGLACVGIVIAAGMYAALEIDRVFHDDRD